MEQSYAFAATFEQDGRGGQWNHFHYKKIIYEIMTNGVTLKKGCVLEVCFFKRQ